MRDTHIEYRFIINALSPDNLPMSHLAAYMADLARLLGESDRVHFLRLEPGSTVLVQVVEPEAVPMVRDRINAIAGNDATYDAIKAYDALNQRLAQDNATGSLREGGNDEVIRFSGCEQSRSLASGAFNQPGILDGVLIRVGGRDDTVPVHLRDGDTIHMCNASRDMARRLASHLYGAALRVYGNGCWERNADGLWRLKRFNITGFEELGDAPLGEVAERLRVVDGDGWKSIDDSGGMGKGWARPCR